MLHRSFLSKCSSWREFVSYADKLKTTKEKGDLFEELVRLYLTVCPEYQTKLSDVWRLADIPPEVAGKLNLPSTDEGIDLIAKTRNGEFWAIQAKYRSDTETALTRKDLSTFSQLSFSYCKNITLGVVAHTTQKPVKKKELLGNVVEIGLSRWLELTPDEWAAIRAQSANKTHKPSKREPRPHQKTALDKIRKHYLKGQNPRGRMIMPCASGKSLTAFWAAQSLKAQTTVLAVPSLMLIKQSVGDWTREYLAHGKMPDWLCVCSDETVGKSTDSFVSSTYEMGIPTTTDAGEIAAFLKKRSSEPKVIFTTYQSSPRLAKAARESGCVIDLCILDEAHKTVGEKSSAFATLPDDRKIKVKNRLFMTATERVLHGKNDEVLSMDDEKIYGSCFYQLTFKEAIDDGIICDYEILTIFVTDAEVREIIKNNKLVKDENVLRQRKTRESASLAAGVALGKVFSEHKIKHAVSFHKSIAAAKDFESQQNELSKLSVIRTGIENFHISSALSTGERTKVMRDFEKSTRSLITNARCLTEGVDIPAIDCVLFADPKQSVVDIVQAAGRAMRPAEGKKKGYILLPIVVPDGMDFEEFAESTPFKKIAAQITAMSTQDERIKDYFRAVTEGRKNRGGKIVSINGDVPVGININFNEFSKAVETRIWHKVAKVNWRGFEEARKYARSLGLKGESEWRAHTKTPDFPKDIPVNPSQKYRGKGWIGVGDWLGTGTVATYLREYRSFEDARKYARSLDLKGQKQWFAHTKTKDFPNDIPVLPYKKYKGKGWISWGDWLGTGTVASYLREYRSFEDTREYARSLNLKSSTQWFAHTKTKDFPNDIPVLPYKKYKGKGWISWGDWLGTGNIANYLKEYRSFEEARKHAQSLNLKNANQWFANTKTKDFPKDIPVAPNQIYKGKGWISWGDWLGTENVHKKEVRSFEKARDYARSLNLKNANQWRAHTKTKGFPKDIPANPDQKYKGKGWVSWGDWLGTGTVAPRLREYRSFEDAREYARSLNLKSSTQWRAHTKTKGFPKDIPANPDRKYKGKGWVSMGDWLGTGAVATHLREYCSFEEARKYARSLNLKNVNQWVAHTKTKDFPRDDIPVLPYKTYKGKGWISWGDWLGTENVHKKEVRSFEKAREYARSLNLKSQNQWFAHTKTKDFPKDIPVVPSQKYKDKGWISWGDWLGTGNVHKKEVRSFEKARDYARSLNLKSSTQWVAHTKTKDFPKDMPTKPDRKYKGKGWVDWYDWLGNKRPKRS